LQALGINTGETAEDVSDIEDIYVETPEEEITEADVIHIENI